MTRQKTRIAMLASGSGTNVENFINYFSGHPGIEIALVVTDRMNAPVRQKARKAGIAEVYIPPDNWSDQAAVMPVFRKHQIHFVVLAGFLRLVPQFLVQHFDRAMVNIHPALLPGFGGRGMYGMHVHRAVIASGESRSGISIHWVNEHYDQGAMIFPAEISLSGDETPETLASRIHQLEYQHYPRVVEQVAGS